MVNSDLARQKDKRIRVLHVLPRISIGGVSAWLSRVAQRLDCNRFEFHFAVHRESHGPFLEKFTESGARVFHLPNRRHLLSYMRSFRRVLLQSGPYDVVHSHYHFFSGYVLLAAQMARVPIRIAHAETVSDRPIAALPLRERMFARLGRKLLGWCATARLACSYQAGDALFGRGWTSQSHIPAIVLPGGLNIEEFQDNTARSVVRQEIGLSTEKFVVGHVGNFVTAKNHMFLLEIFRQIFSHRPGAVLLLVGDGELRPSIMEKARQLGLSNYVQPLGFRRDVHRLLRAMDVFVFPSLWEGLPIAVLEAQLAGLPVVTSEAVPVEAFVSPSFRRISLGASAQQWADAVLQIVLQHQGSLDFNDPRVMRISIDYHSRILRSLYLGSIPERC